VVEATKVRCTVARGEKISPAMRTRGIEEAIYEWARATGALVALAVGLTATPALGQGNFEIQVYGSEVAAPGQTMIELHSNTAVKGTTRTEDGVVRTQGAAHETLEVTHGFTPWFETGFYLFTSIQPDSGWEWVGDHIRPRFRVPASWQWPVGLSLSNEIGYQRRSFSTDTWTWEIRPIIDQKVGPWYWSFNPAFEKSLKGQNSGAGFSFTPAAKVTYDVTSRVAAGLEYYGDIGPVSNIDPPRKQQHLIFPVIDVDLGPRWEFNLGIGAGLTSSTDRLIIKMILGYRFGPLPAPEPAR
jgi:hypothetical protein